MALCLARSRKLAISSRTRDSLVKGRSSLSPRRSVSAFQNFTAEEVVGGESTHQRRRYRRKAVLCSRGAFARVCTYAHRNDDAYASAASTHARLPRSRTVIMDRREVVPRESNYQRAHVRKNAYTYREKRLKSIFFNKIISLTKIKVCRELNSLQMSKIINKNC